MSYDTVRFGTFDANTMAPVGQAGYIAAHAEFYEPTMTDDFAQHLSAGMEPRLYQLMKYRPNPGPLHAYPAQLLSVLCYVPQSKAADPSVVAALEAQVAALKAAIVPGARWYFQASQSVQLVSALILSVTFDTTAEGGYNPQLQRFETLVTAHIETDPGGWRLESPTVVPISAVQIPGYVDVTGVPGDMDAETLTTLLPVQVTSFIAAGIRSGVNYNAATVQDYGTDATYPEALSGTSAKLATLGTVAPIGTASSLDVNTLRGRYEFFARVLQTNASPAATSYNALSSVNVANPSDSVTKTGQGVAATLQPGTTPWSDATKGYEVVDLGAIVVPVQDVPGIASGSGYGPVAAQVTIADASGTYNGVTMWQTFTLIVPALLTSVTLRGFYDSPAYPSAEVSLYTAVGGTLIAPIGTAAFSSSEADVVLPVSAVPLLAAGSYAILVQTDDRGGIQLSKGAAYAGGSGFWFGNDLGYDFRLIVTGQPLLTFGNTVAIEAAGSSGAAYLDYTDLIPRDEAYALVANAFPANEGITSDFTNGKSNVNLASASGTGASLLYRSASIGTDRIGPFKLRPGNNRVHFIAGTPPNAVPGAMNGSITYWPCMKMPPGV